MIGNSGGGGVRNNLATASRYWRGIATSAVAALSVAAVTLIGMDDGSPVQSVRMLSGAAWLPSSKVGQLTLLDGSSTEVAAQVQVAAANDQLDVVQQGSHAYAIDRTAGTMRRVDGATFEMTTSEAPIPDARTGLTAFAAPETLYTMDTKRGVLAVVDPRTLARRGDLFSVGADLDAGAATVDDAGRLWLIDHTTGDLTRIAAGSRAIYRGVTSPGRSVLSVADGNPVIVNTDDRKAVTVDATTGKLVGTFDMDLRQGDTVQVSGSPHSQRVYVVASRGVLTICDLKAGTCDTAVPLNSGSTLGAAVEAGNRVFVPDFATGQVWIVDLSNHSARHTQVLTPPSQFQLLTRDGMVFFNDPNSERAGVIQFDGTVTKAAKYDPANPSKGLTQPPGQPSAAQPQPNQPAPASEPLPPSSSPLTQQPSSQQQTPNEQQPTQPQPPPVQYPPPAQGNPPPLAPPSSSAPPPPQPVLRITLSKANPTVGENVTLRVDTTEGATPRTAHWDFGDGQQGTGVAVPHQWAAARTYQVSVQATMPDDQQATVSASIQVSPVPKVRLTVTSPSHGKVTGNGIACPPTCTVSVDKGQSVTLAAQPDSGARFVAWGGACGGNQGCTVVMDSNKTVSATFNVPPAGDFTVGPLNGGHCFLRSGGAGTWDVDLWFTIGWTGVNGAPMPANKLRLTTDVGRSRDWGFSTLGQPGNWFDTFIDPDNRYLNRLLRVTVTVDPDNAVAETVENNNRFVLVVDLRTPLPPANTNKQVPCHAQ
jgi:hypothetical protein